jgi:hypothetical protein
MTVTFFENDDGSDSVSTYQVNQLDVPEDLTLFANLSPAFSNPGFTFTGWNTAANGGGTAYSNGASYTFDSSMTLYAQWSSVPDVKTVTFMENDSVSDATTAYQLGSSAESLTLLTNLSPAFSNPGFTFAGWSTAANGGGTAYSNGASYAFDSNMTLYAQWTAVPTSTVTFDGNGGVGSVASVTEPPGTTIALPTGAGLTLSGFTFSGWNTVANGTGTEYAGAQSLTVASSERLYAQWTPVSSTTPPTPPSTSGSTSGSTSPVTVSFVANGGSGSLTTINETSGGDVTLPSSSSVIRDGYTLTSWNTEKDGAGTSYKPGAVVSVSTSLTLYAQWTSTGAAPAVLYGAIGDFAKNSKTLTASLERQVRALATVLKAKHYTKVKLYGYSAATGLATLDRSLSEARAASVASYLHEQLRSKKVTGVTIQAAGEGSVAGKTSSLYSRVEVFVS